MFNPKVNLLVDTIGGLLNLFAAIIVAASLLLVGEWVNLLVGALVVLFIGPVLQQILGIVLMTEHGRLEQISEFSSELKSILVRIHIKTTVVQLIYGIAVLYFVAEHVNPTSIVYGLALTTVLYGFPWIALATQDKSTNSSSWGNAYLFGCIGLLAAIVMLKISLSASIIALAILMLMLFGAYRMALDQKTGW